MNRYFKELKDFPDYFVSKNGKIFSKKSNKYLKINNNHVILNKDGKKYVRSINTLLKMTFEEIVDNNVSINGNIYNLDYDFKPIIDFEGYSINKFGNIYSNKKKKFKKTIINPYGYECVILCKNSIKYTRFIHRLVYESWKGEIKDNLTVDHIDENKRNNNIENLQLLNRSENVLKFHSERVRNRNIDGFIKIENFDNYYINENGDIISFKYGERSHNIVCINNLVFLRKNNKRYCVNVKYLLNKYFNKEYKLQKGRKYKNID